MRRKADPAKDLAKQFIRKWQDNPQVAGDATHDEMRSERRRRGSRAGFRAGCERAHCVVLGSCWHHGACAAGDGRAGGRGRPDDAQPPLPLGI